MMALRVAERRQRHEPAHLGGVVVLDCRLEVLALRCRLAQLSTQPAEKAHGCLVRHAEQAIRRSLVRGLGRLLGVAGVGSVRPCVLVGEAVRAEAAR